MQQQQQGSGRSLDTPPLTQLETTAAAAAAAAAAGDSAGAGMEAPAGDLIDSPFQQQQQLQLQLSGAAEVLEMQQQQQQVAGGAAEPGVPAAVEGGLIAGGQGAAGLGIGSHQQGSPPLARVLSFELPDTPLFFSLGGAQAAAAAAGAAQLVVLHAGMASPAAAAAEAAVAPAAAIAAAAAAGDVPAALAHSPTSSQPGPGTFSSGGHHATSSADVLPTQPLEEAGAGGDDPLMQIDIQPQLQLNVPQPPVQQHHHHQGQQQHQQQQQEEEEEDSQVQQQEQQQNQGLVSVPPDMMDVDASGTPDPAINHADLAAVVPVTVAPGVEGAGTAFAARPPQGPSGLRLLLVPRFKPPSPQQAATELLALGLQPEVHREPFYGNAADKPQQPAVFAGREFR
jgi:hypothetical protein